jgi:hypothetical protein
MWKKLYFNSEIFILIIYNFHLDINREHYER